MGRLAAAPRALGVYSGFQETLRLEHRLDPYPEPDAGPDDATLLVRVAHGDLEAFHAFYRRHAGRVLAYARQLGRTRATASGAEDVVQEVFTAVWSKAASYNRDRGDAAGWLYTMTRNKLIDHWRKAGNMAGETVAEPFDVQHLAGRDPGRDLALTMRQALARVEPQQRAAIEMAYFGGLTYEETARRLALPVGTLKSRIRSGLRAMRSLLEEGRA